MEPTVLESENEDPDSSNCSTSGSDQSRRHSIISAVTPPMVGTSPVSRSPLPESDIIRALTPLFNRPSDTPRTCSVGEYAIAYRSSPNVVEEPQEIPVELNIMRLKKTFLEAQVRGYDGLVRYEFIDIMKKTIGSGMTEEEIDTLFTKVDIESKGSLSWLTFLNFFAQEYQEKNRMATNLTSKPFPHGAVEHECTRRDSIVSVCFMPVYQQGIVNYKRGRYVSITSDGFVSIWNMAMKHITSFGIESTSELPTPMLVYDMVYITSLNLIAVSTSVRDIIFFEISGQNAFAKSYHMKGLEHSAMCMDFCQLQSKVAILMWGDMAGNVFGLEFDMQQAGLFGLAKVNQKNEYVKIKFADITKGAYVGTTQYSLMYLHDDWVSKVKFVKENDIFISCCQDENTCMYLGDLKERKTCYYFNMKKGAISFDYCPVHNVIAAGGMDYCIRVWNPYVRSDATIIFKGFAKPVTHVAINSKRGDIIGVDKGNGVRIFSLKDQVLLQIITNRSVSTSWLPVTAIYINQHLQLVVLATSRLSVLQNTQCIDDRLAEQATHARPVRCLCYSEAYEEVISACEESVINVWNLRTGARVIQIADAHTRKEMGESIHIELTSMNLDKSGRRLITGGKNGNLKIWNYSNGAALHSLYIPETNNITGIINTEDKIYVCGWNKMLGMFIEGSGSEEYKAFRKVHSEEILSMVQISPNIIVTAAYDGELVVWALDKAAVLCRLHYLTEVDRERNDAMLRARLQAKSRSIAIASPIDGKLIECSKLLESSKYRILPNIGSKTMNPSRLISLGAGSSASTKPNLISPASITPLATTALGSTPLVTKHVSTTAEPRSMPKSWRKHRSERKPLIHPEKTNPPSLNMPSIARPKSGNKKLIHGYAIEALLHLNNRPFDKNTANLLTSGAGGWVRAWNVDKRGGHLIAQFNPVRNPGENTCALATDADNKYLITGDSQGYVAVWDIRSFGISADSRAKLDEMSCTYNDIDRSKFVYLRKSALCQKLLSSMEEKKKNHTASFDSTGQDMFRQDPPLLTVHLGHTRGINSILYIDKYHTIITASSDGGVRVWSLYGVYYGTFGHHTWEDIELLQENSLATCRVPSDIKRVASATTLKVLNAGKHVHWGQAIATMKHMGFLENKVVDEILEHTIKPTQILGKFYQSRMRHRLFPTLPKLIEIYDAVSVWHTIRYCEMAPTSTFRPLVLMGLSKEQRGRLMANENAAVLSKVKSKSGKKKRLKKSETSKVAKKLQMRVAQDKIRENYQTSRAGVERIDVDCRMVGNRMGAEPIVIC